MRTLSLRHRGEVEQEAGVREGRWEAEERT